MRIIARLTTSREPAAGSVAGIYRVPLVMEVHPTVPATTVPEFIAFCKENPGKINLASAGTGTITHIAGEGRRSPSTNTRQSYAGTGRARWL